MKKITGRLAEKNGQRYAVINLKSPEGKRVQKWVNLNLEFKRNTETEANRRLAELLDQYNSDDMYKMDEMSHSEKERIRLANLYVDDYMKEWIENHKINISILTYDTYRKMIYNRITSHFSTKKIKLKELTGDDMNEFYVFLIKDGLKGATAQRHHSLMHLAFKHAVKRGIIPVNPCDQAERPKAEKYVGEYKDGARTGRGAYYYNDGSRYEGMYLNGKKEGKGTYYFKDGDKYVGDLYDGRFCGYGVYYFKNGDRYEGQWKNDQRDGRGTYYYASGKRQTGTWSNGKFIG
mgnify:CR=1 FL=1